MCVLSVNIVFYKMCTGGRIRLFWGVSPDFMVLTLVQKSLLFYFLFFLDTLQKTQKIEKIRDLGTPKYYIYIYIA